MRRAARRLSDDAGVTLIELVVASAVLLIAAIGVLTALMFATTATTQSSVRQAALSLANERIERARNMAYDDVGTFPFGTVAGTIPQSVATGPFVIDTAVAWVQDPVTSRAAYKTIQVRVSWQRPRPGSMSVASAIYGKSNLVNVGDLRIRVRNETGDPITNATVAISRGAIAINTADAFFGNLAAGPATASVTSVDYVFDNSELASITIVPDVVTERVVVGYPRSRVVITVVDENGDLMKNARLEGELVHTVKGKQWIKTGADGQIIFDYADGLLPGEYTLYVTTPSEKRTPVEFTFTVVGGEVVNVTAKMGPRVLPGSLTVAVRDANGLSLNGATVAVSAVATGAPAVTGSPATTVNGEAALKDVFAGDYRVTVTLTGYVTYTGTVTMGTESQTLNVVLAQTGSGGGTNGSLRIVMTRVDGSPASGVSVRITYPDSSVIYRTTDANGQISLGNLVPGNYAIRPSGGTTTYHRVIAGSETLVQLLRP